MHHFISESVIFLLKTNRIRRPRRDADIKASLRNVVLPVLESLTVVMIKVEMTNVQRMQL